MPRKPWIFGVPISHWDCGYSCQHSLFVPLHSPSRVELQCNTNALLPLADFIEEAKRPNMVPLRQKRFLSGASRAYGGKFPPKTPSRDTLRRAKIGEGARRLFDLRLDGPHHVSRAKLLNRFPRAGLDRRTVRSESQRTTSSRPSQFSRFQPFRVGANVGIRTRDLPA